MLYSEIIELIEKPIVPDGGWNQLGRRHLHLMRILVKQPLEPLSILASDVDIKHLEFVDKDITIVMQALM